MIANLKIGPCPKCGSTTFHATAHATQTWLVDEDGEFIKAETNCDELTPPTIEIVGFPGLHFVTHSPDTEDLFECSKCGAEVPAKYVYSE